MSVEKRLDAMKVSLAADPKGLMHTSITLEIFNKIFGITVFCTRPPDKLRIFVKRKTFYNIYIKILSECHFAMILDKTQDQGFF